MYDCIVLPGASPARHAAVTQRYSSVSKSLLADLDLMQVALTPLQAEGGSSMIFPLSFVLPFSYSFSSSAGRPDPGF
jgi:hypothetical protein